MYQAFRETPQHQMNRVFADGYFKLLNNHKSTQQAEAASSKSSTVSQDRQHQLGNDSNENASQAEAASTSLASTRHQEKEGVKGATVNGAAASVGPERIDGVHSDGNCVQKQAAETSDFARAYK